MGQPFDLQAYLTKGVERIVANAVKATLRDPVERAFMVRFAAASRKASKIREEEKKRGQHVPPFLITSITSSCNLHCAGCYSRCNHATVDSAPIQQLSGAEWLRVFREAEALGISFILLAGGEPMLRRDVIEASGTVRTIIFPIFTNGTVMDEGYFQLFRQCRNLIPVMSIEGERELTDRRRGPGIYDCLISNMDRFRKEGLLFGVSVTVTRENVREVVSDTFLSELAGRGCKLVIYVEFVPVTEESRSLAPEDSERAFLDEQLQRLRRTYSEMVFMATPYNRKP